MLVICCEQFRDVHQRRREDDRDDAGLVDLQRDVGGLAPVGATAHLAAGVLHRDAALAHLDEHDRDRDEATDEQDPDHQAPAAEGAGDVLLLHEVELGGQLADDRHVDQQRHAVADAT
jgi:hypothetical protein